MLSRTTQYAVSAMTFLAAQPPGKRSGAREIAKARSIPKPFLWKVLHKLERNGLVRSFKGVGGAYELARPAGRIRLNEILCVAATLRIAPAMEGNERQIPRHAEAEHGR